MSAVALLITGWWFTESAPAASIAQADIDEPLPRHRTTFIWLCAVYTAEAFVYIIPATFLVAIIAKIPELAHYAALTWVFVGLAAAFATFGWIPAAARLGKARSLALALALQAIGIAAPVFSHSAFAVILAGVALGGTFIAITLFAAGLGRDIFPRETSAAVSRLTALYSVGQIVGPIVATQLALRFGSYQPALLAASIVAAIATVVTLVTIREAANASCSVSSRAYAKRKSRDRGAPSTPLRYARDDKGLGRRRVVQRCRHRPIHVEAAAALMRIADVVGRGAQQIEHRCGD